MSFDEDPEVLADMQLREATLRERGRSREMPKYEPPAIVGQWPCRVCKTPVDITDEAIKDAEVFDRKLARDGDEHGNHAPLDRNRIAVCDACRAKGMSLIGQRKREQVDKMAALIRELRGGTTLPAPPGPAPSQQREAELMREIISRHHPDPEGLLKAIRDGRNGGKKPRGAL